MKHFLVGGGITLSVIGGLVLLIWGIGHLVQHAHWGWTAAVLSALVFLGGGTANWVLKA